MYWDKVKMIMPREVKGICRDARELEFQIDYISTYIENDLFPPASEAFDMCALARSMTRGLLGIAKKYPGNTGKIEEKFRNIFERDIDLAETSVVKAYEEEDVRKLRSAILSYKLVLNSLIRPIIEDAKLKHDKTLIKEIGESIGLKIGLIRPPIRPQPKVKIKRQPK